MESPRGNRDDRPFPCSKCPASFKTRSKLHRHKYTHTGKKPFKCPVSGCSRLFIEKYELRNHSDRYHSGIIREKLVKCDLCECAFYTKSSLATHLATRHSYCASCDVDLKDFSALTAHQRAHEQGSSFMCHLCSIGILDGLQFKNHWLTHVDAPRHIQCSKCSKKFKSEKNLQSHFSYTHALLEVRAQCKLCPKSFPNLRQLRHHETGHVRQHACYFCKKNFGNISSLRDHMTTHTREVTYFYDVEQCGFSTSTYSGLSSHVNNMHTANRICKLAQHFNTHTLEKPYRCALCKKPYHSSEGLKFHITSHTTEKPWKCSICGNSYAASSVLKAHKRTHDPNRKQLFCHLCNYSGVYLSEHIKRKHSNLPKPCQCHHCDSKFWKKHELRRHINSIHVNPKVKKPRPNYQCQFCHKILTGATKLRDHIAIHTGESFYSCRQCDASFRNDTSLRDHVEKWHRGEKHPCQRCHYVFFSKTKLDYHVKIRHSGVTHKCGKCSKAFRAQMELTRHLKLVHSDVKNFPCPICGRMFKMRCHVKTHVQNVHEQLLLLCEKISERLHDERSPFGSHAGDSVQMCHVWDKV